MQRTNLLNTRADTNTTTDTRRRVTCFDDIPEIKKSPEAFEKLQADDAKKSLLCEQHGIKLYRVPYWVKALPEFVSDDVCISVSAPFDPGRKLGINMTSCYTGASSAKKTVFAKHSKQH